MVATKLVYVLCTKYTDFPFTFLVIFQCFWYFSECFFLFKKCSLYLNLYLFLQQSSRICSLDEFSISPTKEQSSVWEGVLSTMKDRMMFVYTQKYISFKPRRILLGSHPDVLSTKFPIIFIFVRTYQGDVLNAIRSKAHQEVLVSNNFFVRPYQVGVL